MSLMMQSPVENRLTARVLRVWNELAAAGLPKRLQIDPRHFGLDWSNCLTIDLDPIVPRSRFTYIGSALQNLVSVSVEGRTFFELHEETLVKLHYPHIPRVMANKIPVKFAGLAQHDGKDILYRTVLMPLSDFGDQVDALVVGTSYREISIQKVGPTGEYFSENQLGRLLAAS